MMELEGEEVFFPDQIMFEILSRLCIDDLISSMRVSKRWYKLTKDPYFIPLQSHRAASRPPGILLYQDETGNPDLWFLSGEGGGGCRKILGYINCGYSIYGSSNGLLCISIDTLEGIYIYNPTIREYNKVPDDDLVDDNLNLTYAFGFDSITSKYKVIQYDESGYYLGIITLGEKGPWRKLKLPYHHIQFQNPSHAVFVDGAFHWLIYEAESSTHLRRPRILAFNLTIEEFNTIDFVPVNMLPHNYSNLRLVKNAECLTIVDKKLGNSFRLWQMKGSKMKGEYSIQIPQQWDQCIFHIVTIFADGNVLLQTREMLQTRDMPPYWHYVLLHNIHNHCFTVKFYTGGGTVSFFDTHFFVPTLTSPAAICGQQD